MDDSEIHEKELEFSLQLAHKRSSQAPGVQL